MVLQFQGKKVLGTMCIHRQLLCCLLRRATLQRGASLLLKEVQEVFGGPLGRFFRGVLWILS